MTKQQRPEQPGSDKVKEPKQPRISFRTSPDFKKRVKAAAAKIKVDETVLEKAAIEAVVEHVEKYGNITLPVPIVKPLEKKD